MSEMILKPYVSVGTILFGEERDTVRKESSDSFREFKKTKFSQNTTDDFGGYHVFYDGSDKVEAVEVFPGNSVLYRDKNLLRISYAEAVKLLKDHNCREDEYGFIDSDAGISVYAPDHNQIESVLLFRKGYYD